MAPPPSTAASCSWSPASTSLQPFRRRVADYRGQVGDGDHGAFVGEDQRARRDPALGEIGEEPGGVRGDLDAGRAQFVGGVLGGGGAEHRPVPGTGGGGQDPGLPGPGRAGDYLDGACRGQDVPDGGGLVQPQPAQRGALACVMPAAAQLRLEHALVGAKAARGHLARQARRALGLRVREELLLQGQLRGGGVSRDAGPGVHAAPVQLTAQRRGQRRPLRGLQAHHLAGPPRQGLLGQAKQQCLRGLRAHLPGLRRHDQGELLDQVVPGPGRDAWPRPGPGPWPAPAPGPPAWAARPARGPRDARSPCAPGPRAFDTAAAISASSPPSVASHRAASASQSTAPRPFPCATAAWRHWRCTAARARSARGRACTPRPAPARVPSHAPARYAWNTRPSAPA